MNKSEYIKFANWLQKRAWVDMDKDFEDFVDEYFEVELANNTEIIGSVSEINLIEELRLKLIGMECFADEYYNEKAKEGTRTVFQELKNWINKKRELYSR